MEGEPHRKAIISQQEFNKFYDKVGRYLERLEDKHGPDLWLLPPNFPDAALETHLPPGSITGEGDKYTTGIVIEVKNSNNT